MNTQRVNPFLPSQLQMNEPARPQTKNAEFGEVLKKTVQEVNQLQVAADKAALQLAAGEAEDIHQVMIVVEQARLAMELTVQLRNKVVEAYQETMRMQI